MTRAAPPTLRKNGMCLPISAQVKPPRASAAIIMLISPLILPVMENVATSASSTT